MELIWENNHEIRFHIEDGQAILSANADGLLSLAAHFSALAAESPGRHIHYDEYNAFEEGSDEFIVELI